MPVCTVDDQLSERYQKDLKKLRRQLPHIDEDLGAAFGRIESSYASACSAAALLGFKGAVWKYRVSSQDAGSGSSQALRVIAYLDVETQKLYPVLLYHKAKRADAKPTDIRKAISELKATLQAELPEG
ncbi:MAG: hypothetical protein GC160_02735 [Acidobacteria bacterium]|nr:hypothetical protein [Acidobacteriota bacterium]